MGASIFKPLAARWERAGPIGCGKVYRAAEARRINFTSPAAGEVTASADVGKSGMGCGKGERGRGLGGRRMREKRGRQLSDCRIHDPHGRGGR